MKGPEEQLPGARPARPPEVRWPDPNAPGLEPEEIIAQLRAAAAEADWAWFQRRGHWSCMATGDDASGWPEVLDDEELAQLSAEAGLSCHPTGSGPTSLGWLLARPDGQTDFAALALRFGFVLQRLQLQRTQAIQQVL